MATAGLDDTKIVITLDLDKSGYDKSIKATITGADDLKRQINRTADSVSRLEQRQRGLWSTFRDTTLIMGNMRFALMDLYDVFLKLPVSIVKTAGELERMQIMLKGLSNASTEAGKQLEANTNFDFIINRAKNAPFAISAITDSFVKLKTGGVDPTNGSLQAMINSVAKFGGTSETLKRASVAIQQMGGKGVISMEELRQQLGEAVPTAMQDMADGMGVSMQKLAKIVQTGTLKTGPALQAMFNRMRITAAGAAEEMMSSMSGMLSRLQTEWSLWAKAVYDSGLGDTVKEAIGELTKVFQTREAMEFAKEFGHGLQSIFSTAKQVVEVLYEYRDVLSLLAKGWLAYKVATSVLAPMADSLRKLNSSTKQFVGSQISEFKRMSNEVSVANHTAFMSSSTALEKVRKDAAVMMSQSRAAINDQRQALQQLTAQRDAWIASVNKSGGRGVRNVDAANVLDGKSFLSQKEAAEQVARLNAQIADNTRITAQNQAQIALWRANVQGATAIANTHAEVVNNMGTKTRLMGLMSGAAGMAVRSLGAVVGALGGPVGVAIIAISALVGWYYRLKNAANEARLAQVRAKQGTTTDEDVANSESDVARLKEQIKSQSSKADKDSIRRELLGPTGKNSGISEDTLLKEINRVYEERKATREKLDKELAAKEGLLATQRRNRQAQEAEINAEGELRAAKVEIDAVDRAGVSKVNAQKVQSDKEIRALDEKSKTYQTQKNAILARDTEAQIAADRASLKVREESAAKLSAAIESGKLSESDKNAKQEVLDRLNKEIVDKSNELRAMTAPLPVAGVDYKDVDKQKTKKGPKTGSDRVNALIQTLDEDIAGLKAKLAEMNTTTGEVGDTQQKVAELTRKLETNKNWKSATPGEKKQALQLVQEKAELQQLIDVREDMTNRMEKVNSRLGSVESMYEDALQVIADPLGQSFMGSNQRGFERALSKDAEAMQLFAFKMGTTIDEMRAQFATVDFAQNFQKLATDLQTAQQNETGITEDESLRRRRIHDAERENALNNYAIKMRAAGVAEEKITAYNQMASNLIQLQNNETARKARGPMGELVDKWADYTARMREATAGWLNDSTEAFIEFAFTGKNTFKSLVVSILKDIARIQLQQATAGWVSTALNWGASALGISSPGTGGADAGGNSQYSLSSGNDGLGLKNKFANGGIMTEFGSVPLKKYANGGIARSPQLALYGEGRSPEAYVPLPDGRTIPVTMTGGRAAGVGAVNVTVSIVNNGDGTKQDNVSTDQSQYKQLGQRIREVVRDELVVQARPGGALHK